jgi:hypothetical protein
MMHDIATEIAALDGMATGDLAGRYAELHGPPQSPCLDAPYFRKRLQHKDM